MSRVNLIESPIPFKGIMPVKNADTNTNALTIPVGTPLVLNLSNAKTPAAYANGRAAGSEDGFQVVLPSTGGAVAANHLQWGVALQNILYNQVGETMVTGVCNAVVVLATRAGTSGASSWPATTIGSGSTAALTIDTVNNAFGTFTSNVTGAGTPFALLLDSLSMAASATSTADSRTVITTLARVFLRMM